MLLAGLKQYTENITAVVTVTDNGGSSGRLRNDFDIVPPGDIRNCLVALADVDPLITKVFQYRFSDSEFKGHCFGNLFITTLAQIVGDFETSIQELNRLLRVKGRVLPAAGAKVSLVAHHPDGTKSTGEVQITRSRKPIERVELRPAPVPLSDEIRQAVRAADLFLFGPGSLFTSVIPNLLLDGLMRAIRANGSPQVYIANIMTQPGETDGFTLADHLRALARHVGPGFPDHVLAHAGELPERVLEKYRAENAVPVKVDVSEETARREFNGIRVICRDFFGGVDTARHDPALLARALDEEFLQRLKRRAREDGPRAAPLSGASAARSFHSEEEA